MKNTELYAIICVCITIMVIFAIMSDCEKHNGTILTPQERQGLQDNGTRGETRFFTNSIPLQDLKFDHQNTVDTIK